MKEKRLFLYILTACLVIGVIGGISGCSGSQTTDQTDSDERTAAASEKNEEPVSLVISFRTTGNVPEETQIQKVEAALNEILKDRINAKAELKIIHAASYKHQMALVLSGNEQLDVMGVVPQMLPSAVAGGQLLDLTDLLQTHGQGILRELSAELLDCGRFDGTQYTIPIQADTAVGMGFYVMRRDIVDKYRIDLNSVKTYEDLTEVFQLVHDNEPELTMVAPRNVGMSFLEYNCSWDELGDSLGVLENYGQAGSAVVNLFQTDAYQAYLEVMRDWYQRGFISADVMNEPESGPELVKAGTLFAYAHANKPGVLTQETILTGYEMVGCQVLETINVTADAWQWAIPNNSSNPDKAMEFLNLLYTDRDVINLLAYGLEGESYVVHEDGRIGYPEGIGSDSVGYSMAGIVWSFGNEFNAYVWETNDRDIWEQTREWNKKAVTSKAFGFVFDSTQVSMEMAAVQNVYDQYRLGLECGLVEPAAALDEMNQKLYSAGLQDIIDEKQRQLDHWADLKD